MAEGKQVFVPLGEQQEDEEADQSLPTQDKVVGAFADDSRDLFPIKAHCWGCSLPWNSQKASKYLRCRFGRRAQKKKG